MSKVSNEQLKYARFKLFWEAHRLKNMGVSKEQFLYYVKNMPEELFCLEAQQALDIIDIDLIHIVEFVWSFKR